MEPIKKCFDIYLGNLKTKKRKNGDEFLVGDICLEQIYEHLPDHLIHEGNNGKHYTRVIIQKNVGGIDKYGNTHSISVDTYKPEAGYKPEKKDEE